CETPEAALEFLTEFANPEKMGAEVITATRWGAGPFRMQHLEERTRGLWLGYGFSREGLEGLIAALKANLNTSLINHRYRLRLPNQAEHLAAFDAVVRPALESETASAPKTTMDEVNNRWKSLWKDVPDAQKRQWIRLNYGLGSSD